MKHLKKFNEGNEEVDLNLLIAKIEEHFSEDDIVSRYDEEILEWVDDDWQEDYESEYEWYIDHNNGEAQDVILNDILKWIKETESINLSSDQEMELRNLIKDKYDCLN